MDIQIAYRNHRIEGSSSDSDSDSNDDSDVWKRHSSSRATKKDSPSKSDPTPLPAPAEPLVPAANGSRKRKVNKIWSNVLEEETVVSELCQIGLEAKCPDNQNRNCESYNYRLKYSDPRREQDMDTDGSMQDDQEEPAGEDLKERLKSKRQRKYGSTDSLTSHMKKEDGDDAGNRFPQLSRADLEVARKIVHILGERKHYLIYRVVHVIGADKAFQLLKMTENVEEQGGMLIKNNARRRTPGGVYLQLLKSDKDVTAEQVAEIFAHEVPFEKFKEFRKLHGKLNKHKGGTRKRKKKKSKSNGKEDDDESTKMVCETAVVDEPKVEEVTQASPPSSDPLSVDTKDCVFGNGTVAPAAAIEVIKEEPESDIEEGEIVDT